MKTKNPAHQLAEEEKTKLIEYMMQFISPTRWQRFEEVMSHRMKHMCVVLENIYQAHNASAVLRSCDCFGIQNVHFIENLHQYKISADVAMGSSNWLSIHRYTKEENNTKQCLTELKQKGYRIIATTPHENDCTLDELNVDTPFALVFGTEIDGITKDVYEMADEFVRIPMYGFTESFNISVCAALCMHTLTEKIRSKKLDIELSQVEKNDLYIEWFLNSNNTHELIINEYLQKLTAK